MNTPTRSRFQRLRDFSLLFGAVGLIIAAFFSVSMQIGMVSIASGSMEPAMSTGDIVIFGKIATKSVSTGDVLILPHPQDRSIQFAHRVVGASFDGDALLVESKGDANPQKDGWVTRVAVERVPKVLAVLPTASIVESPYLLAGFIAFFLFAAALWVFLSRID